MCVIIIKQQGMQLPEGVAKRSGRINPHGLGIIWLDTFEVTFHKSSDYKKLHTDRPFIAHFRYATVGAIGKSNTHPFQCGKNKNEWLMMNGTIKGLGDNKNCDSKVLAQNLGDVPRQGWEKELKKHGSRFVTINVANKTFQVYNKELWTISNGIWYSKDNVMEGNLVAVYGTLKKGYSNYWNYLYSSEYIGSGRTVNKYPLIINGLPYLIDEIDKGHKVEVDVFSVSHSELMNLDRLEGHPQWYRRKQVPIEIKGKNVLCWVYFNLSQTVTNDSVLHKKYTQDDRPAYKKTYDYKPKTKGYPRSQRSFFFDDVMMSDYDRYPQEAPQGLSTLDHHNEKPVCIDCFHDLEHDAFANYYCKCCGGWFSETEILRCKS